MHLLQTFGCQLVFWIDSLQWTVWTESNLPTLVFILMKFILNTLPYFFLIPFFFLYPPNTMMDFQSAISNIKPKVNKLYIKQQHPYTINPIKN